MKINTLQRLTYAGFWAGVSPTILEFRGVLMLTATRPLGTDLKHTYTVHYKA